MTPPSTDPALLARFRQERQSRTSRSADQCVLLAVVTSTDVAAALIDQAVDLHRAIDRAA